MIQRKQAKNKSRPLIGVALGSGSARGWAHIGVLQALEAAGIEIDIVCGTSIGALVGGVYASGKLDEFTNWVKILDKHIIVRYLDINLLTGGGFIEGARLINFLKTKIGDASIEQLPRPFACVASDLETGREIWFDQGSILEAIRCSIAIPGIFTPVRANNRWVVDGGLVNPVPVSLCRAMGADIVIAVNLNGDILGKHFAKTNQHTPREIAHIHPELSLLERFAEDVKNRAGNFVQKWRDEGIDDAPGLFDVVASSINIMQDRITRSRMAGDPPDILLSPRLAAIGLLEFDRASEAIEEGRRCVQRHLPALEELIPSAD